MSALPSRRCIFERSLPWLAALWLLFSSAGAAADEPEARTIDAAGLCKMYWGIGADQLTYCRNERMGEMRPAMRRAVVIVHGKNRNAQNYFDAVSRLAAEEGRAQDTLLIAVQFLTRADTVAHQLPSNVLYWDTEGWKSGMKSLNGSKISSFEVLDEMLERLIEYNPNLDQIVIAGHSAGAQFVQKHAAARHLDVSAWKGQLHYVVTNAGTYMYLSGERPASTHACKRDYNNYRYGIEQNRVEYFGSTSPDSLWKKFTEFPVTILLGTEDTEQDGDRTCAAMAQGPNRFERGKHFHRLTAQALPSHVPGAALSKLRLRIIPHVGHDFERMWDSRCGRDLLFGSGECQSSPPPRAAFPL
jgi:pimeloyl-ACP methyl ester carboxylesterase